MGIQHTWERSDMHTKFWLERYEWKKLLRTPRNKWKDNIKMDSKDTQYQDVNWITLDQDRGREAGRLL
jgi:hypothetical protein